MEIKLEGDGPIGPGRVAFFPGSKGIVVIDKEGELVANIAMPDDLIHNISSTENRGWCRAYSVDYKEFVALISKVLEDEYTSTNS